jgi:hypothetical protein
VKPSREGPTVPIQLRAGLQSPNRIVTPAGTTTICMARSTTRIDNASYTIDVSYAAPQAHRIVNVALHREYSPGITFIFSHGMKDHYHV